MQSLLKYTPAYYIFLIFWSYSSYHFFYTAFGIAIYQYLDTSELLLSFLPHTYGILILAFIVLYRFTTKSSSRPYLKDAGVKNAFRTGGFYLSFILNPRKRRFFPRSHLVCIFFHSIFTMSFMILILISYYVWKTVEPLFADPPAPFFKVWPSLTIPMFLVSLFCAKTISKFLLTRLIRYVQLQMHWILSVYWVIVFFIIGAISNNQQAKKLLSGSSRTDVSVETSNGNFRTNIDTVYVGRTNGYIFFRSLKDSTNIILSADDVKRFSIRQHH